MGRNTLGSDNAGGSPRAARPGEQAILLAREVSADYLLIDDARGRFLAEAQHVRTIGTIGILRSASTDGLIDFRHSFDKLMATNFRISSAFRRQILEEFEEK
jgi:predicted nucleic acid-binding protein